VHLLLLNEDNIRFPMVAVRRVMSSARHVFTWLPPPIAIAHPGFRTSRLLQVYPVPVTSYPLNPFSDWSQSDSLKQLFPITIAQCDMAIPAGGATPIPIEVNDHHGE
jgi:hypothetical protein